MLDGEQKLMKNATTLYLHSATCLSDALCREHKHRINTIKGSTSNNINYNYQQ